MNVIQKVGHSVGRWRANIAARFNTMPKSRQSAIILAYSTDCGDDHFVCKPRSRLRAKSVEFREQGAGLLSSTLLRTLAVIAVIVTGLLWFTGRASTAVLVTAIIGIATVFSADSIVGIIAG